MLSIRRVYSSIIKQLSDKKQVMEKIILYIIGCIMFSLGATAFIDSQLGTDPLDVLCLGIQHQWGWKIGTTQSLLALLLIGVYWVITRVKLPPLSPFITLFSCGYMIDFFRETLTTMAMLPPLVLLVMGITLCIMGSSAIIMSSYGIRPMDLVAIALMHKTGKPFWLYKGVLEVLLFSIGYLLGGPVGIGTLAFLFGVGWSVQPIIRLLSRWGLPNYSTVK
jgi:uncharacterized protein